MAKLRKVDKNDKNRVILTEVLPYEVPIIFSNEGYYDFLSEDLKSYPELVEKILFDPEFQVPFNYKIKKTAFAHRTLSVMHPKSQKDVIDFYFRYDLLMIHLCNKSPISLRHPSQVTSMFYEKQFARKFEHHKDEQIDIEVDLDEKFKERKTSSSYFKYKKYDLLLKFYDSYEFIRLEKRYKCLMKFDISNCFNSIYTHSISWAVKDKMFAKSFKNRDSFENEFDRLMQQSNHGETNGILIGPELSRIFAEIILQKIDLNTIERLRKYNLEKGRDYELRRYVDDYFVFTNDEGLSKIILKTFSGELEFYKLYINKGKTEYLRVPFISGITIARTQILKLLDNFFNYYLDKFLLHDDEDYLEEQPLTKKPFKIRSSYGESNKLILELKCIVKNNSIDFESVSRIAFSIIKNKLSILYVKASVEDSEQSHALSSFLLNIYDFLFFLYSMDNCVRITYVMTQIIISTNSFVNKIDEDHKHNIKKKIYDESIFLIKNIKNEENYLSVEVLNLLIGIKDLGEEYLLDEELLYELFEVGLDNKELCYFHFIVLLFYIGNSTKYNSLKKKLERHLIEDFRAEEFVSEKTEKTLLFFDIIACPYISNPCKNEIIELVYKNQKDLVPNETQRNTVRNFISKRKWFVDWSEDINLEYILSKKELTSPY